MDDKPSTADSPHLSGILQEVVENLIDSCIMDDIFSMHRAIKLGYFHIIAPEEPTENTVAAPTTGRSGNGSGRDGSSKLAGSCCRCIKCHSKVAATRFAPHLSNCMGLGRNSSRRANKRIAEQQRLEDYDDDFEDSNYVPSSSSHASSASESNVHRYTNGSVSKQSHSPLKLTISLVPVSGKTDSGTKHVVRAVNVSSGPDHPNPSSQSSRTAASKGAGHLHKSSSAHVLSKSPAEPGVLLKESKVAVNNHHLPVSGGKHS
ncbi:unnamed protein product [Calicophoron daubneyi]|uniref:SAGA-associated factor 11 n=1 Tax=Calicophoron daubneyi TaxID=300641 RepID=A0AAV2TAP0_CALDB